MVSSNHVFIIDDDPSVRKGLARLLRAAGYRVKDFATVMEFLGSHDSDISGCVLMDIRMPGISGKELVVAMKNCGSRLCIIVVSADDNQEARKLAKDMGAIGFFRKPVDGTALLDSIKWTLKSGFTRKNHDKIFQ